MGKEITSTEFEKRYKALNKSQKLAVDTIEGPVMVVAGPGTGKTTILSLRIAQILLKTDVSPENILALTFTNSGVLAMRKKLFECIGDMAYRVNIFTFHSFAEHLIREFSFYFKNLQFSRVVNDIEKIEIIENIIKNNSFKEIVSDYDIFSSLSQISSAINDIKKDGLNPEQFNKKIPLWEDELISDENIFYKRKTGEFNIGDIKPSEKEKIDKKIAKAREINQVFSEYQEVLQEKGLYDFSDMILNVLKELESNQNLKSDLQEKYQYILVDEHQDTNDGQNKLIELLTDAEHLDGHPNLFTVGDEKQSIYRFQGASAETFKYFESAYRDVKIINLEENYRSTKSILDSSYNLIQNSISNSIQLNSNKKENSNIDVLEFSNYKFELLHLADDISGKIKDGVNSSEIAVIYRSNKNVKDIKQVFNYKKIPHTIISKEYLLEDSNIENLINILRVIHNPNDNYSLGKSLFINFLNLDPFDVVNLLEKFSIYKRNNKLNLIDLFNEKEILSDFNIKNIDSFSNLKETIKELKSKSMNSDFESFIKEVIEKTGYLKFMLSADDGQEQILKLDKLFDEIKRQKDANKNYSLENFIKFIDSYKKYNLDIETKDPEVISGVKLITAHKSKGLEFEYVYIINATRNNWEKSRGFNKISLPLKDSKGDIDDERRLFYVAMTRAKNGLYISHSKSDWQGKEQEKTQFISEIGGDFVNNINTEEFEKENINNLNIFITNFKEDKNIFEKDYLKNLFLGKSLSVTALNNYLNCPIRYLFRSLIQLPSEYNSHQIFGNLIHYSLEEFFNESIRQEKILTKDFLISKFESFINNSALNNENYDRYKERGEIVLSDYYEKYKDEWSLNIETEKNIFEKITLDSGEALELSGIVDKVVFLDSKLDGKINIVDYKTGKTYSEKDKAQKADLERQLTFYHLLFRNYNNGKFIVDKAILDFIQKNNKGNYEQYSVDIDNEKINDLIKDINNMAEDVISGEFLNKGCNGKDCEFCSLYKSIK